MTDDRIETDETSNADLLLDDALLERVTQYAQTHGLTVDSVLLEGVRALLATGRRHRSFPDDAARHRARLQGQAICDEKGYTDYRIFAGGRDACIVRIGLNYAILADITPDSYADRWCYLTYDRARLALDAWDGGDDTEPQDWHRHPTSGRRRPNGDASKETVYW